MTTLEKQISPEDSNQAFSVKSNQIFNDPSIKRENFRNWNFSYMIIFVAWFIAFLAVWFIINIIAVRTLKNEHLEMWLDYNQIEELHDIGASQFFAALGAFILRDIYHFFVQRQFFPSKK